MNRFIYIALAVLFPLLIVAYEAFYTVNETEQVIMTQFGKPVGGIVNEAGLKLKIPFIQKVNRIEKRILLWDGSANDMPTKDKLYITVDTFGRWRIKDPLQYFLRLRDERSAQSRLEDILGSETRNAVAKHELIEIVRTTKDRTPAVDPLLAEADVGKLLPIKRGRRQIEEDIFSAASVKLAEFGIELLDIRFKRINYNESVRQKIYARMISERQQIAERFRSEGAGEAAKIIGNKEKDLQRIESEAYRKIQSIQGVADAKATEIYAAAYNQTKSARELYDLVKTLETYKQVIDPSTTLVLTTESELYQLLNGVGQ
ncbi:HflC protein [Alcanivorax nanhaiticus]|uniref:Protein HflC n=1 Tax=Alcanivorax nanhaiticus TaxID=1177154 RepID=A0A095SP58_9GAMM|nr:MULTISPECIES: protease modulator HflC [Gammaproteobacteria]KGD66099.1 HflC protein [Alcanivorax nanhaiticus]MBG58478.1 protease modulator HflC [Porticoccus sp.]|tara:strand:+ start:3169 stop:4116 length:948 start_codon:yes stop_codon:yes gene_type:complete